MQWEFIVALVIAIPIILFPAAFVWYLNLGGIYAAIQEARRKRKDAYEERRKAIAEAEQHVTATATRKQPVEREVVRTKR